MRVGRDGGILPGRAEERGETHRSARRSFPHARNHHGDSMLSQNGWPVLAPQHTHLWVIPDTSRHLRLAGGPAGFVLTHLALWFHEVIEQLDAGPWDEWAYAVRPVTGSSSVMSNHSSGTAVDLNAATHPYGQRDTFGPQNRTRIRTRLERVYDGAIRWGGDYKTTPDDMHFEIATGRDSIAALAARLRNSHRGRRVWSAFPRDPR